MPEKLICRDLTVLIVDDNLSEHFLLGSQDSKYIEAVTVKSWADVQITLGAGGDLGGVDVLLVDISFNKDEDVKKLLESEASILPIGPLLALPFIGQRAVLSCVVYSAHSENPDLHKHPYFLLSMGLILARTSLVSRNDMVLKSRHLSKNDNGVDLSLDREIQRFKKSQIQDVSTALSSGVAAYRDNLESALRGGRVTLLNRNEVLIELRNRRDRLNREEEFLFCDGNEIGLAMAGHNWRDCISIQSLFSDELKRHGQWTSAKLLDAIEEWMLGFPAETSIERAISVFQSYDKEKTASADEERQLVTDKILEMMPTLSSEELTEVLRYCVLFANVRILEEQYETGVRKGSVHETLGTKVSQNTYLGWFGERSKNGIDKVRRHGRFNVVQRLSQGDTSLRRCYLIQSPGARDLPIISPLDYEAICIFRAFENRKKWLSPPSWFRIQADEC